MAITSTRQTYDPNNPNPAMVDFKTMPSLKGKPAQSTLSFQNGVGGMGSISGSGAGMARLSNPEAQKRIADQLALNADPAFQARMAEQAKIVNDRIATRLANEKAARAPTLGGQMQFPKINMPQLAGRSPETQAMLEKAMTDANGSDKLKAKYANRTIEQILSQDPQHAQNALSQQNQMLDLQRSREALQAQQAQQMQNQEFSNQQMKDKFGMDLTLQQMQEQSRANAPMSEFQQARIDDLKAKQEAAAKERELKKAGLQGDLNTSLGNAKEFISNVDRLATIQGKTNTGQIAGSDTAAWLRKTAGDTNLEQLDKGYADLLIQNLGVYKAMGSSLGVNPTDKDIALLKNTVPQITNSEISNQQSLAKMKIPIMEQYNRSYEAAKLKGLDVSGMTPYTEEDFAKVRGSFDPNAQQQLGQPVTQQNPAIPQGWSIEVQ